MGGSGGKKARVQKSSISLQEVRNEINVTPLVDVCLVLLIIFMVIAPMMSRGKQVLLPETQTDPQNDNLQPIWVLSMEGKEKKPIIYLNNVRPATYLCETMKLQDYCANAKNDTRTMYNDPNSASQQKAIRAQLDELYKATQNEWELKPQTNNQVTIKIAKDVHYKHVYPIIEYIHSKELNEQGAIDFGTTKLEEGNR